MVFLGLHGLHPSQEFKGGMGAFGGMVGSGGGSHFVAATAALPRQECLKKRAVKTPKFVAHKVEKPQAAAKPRIFTT